MPARRTLILGAAIGYRKEQVLPFLRSLRNSGYTGDVALFVDRRLRRALRQDLEVRGVELVSAWPWLPMRLGLVGRRRIMRIAWQPVQAAMWRLLQLVERLPRSSSCSTRVRLAIGVVLHTPMEARFLRYLPYVQEHIHDQVLLCDVRDVLFQADPFRAAPARGLGISVESNAYRIATESHNAEWILRVCGPDVLARIGDERVANVGVTIGARSSIISYLEAMTDEILRTSPRAADIAGADTAIHNALIWTRRLGEVACLPPLESPIATLNGVNSQELRLDAEGFLMNLDGSRPSILHQYDRQPSISGRLLLACTSEPS